jgi:hypothetical protein
MGCCNSRSPYLQVPDKKLTVDFAQQTKLGQFRCSDLRLLNAQILQTSIDKSTYNYFAKDRKINCVFEFFAIRGRIHIFELKMTLMLFSKDSFQNKLDYFYEVINGSERNMIRFLEWRYQLVNERLPKEFMVRKKEFRPEMEEVIKSGWCKAGSYVVSVYSHIKHDTKAIEQLGLLSLGSN